MHNSCVTGAAAPGMAMRYNRDSLPWLVDEAVKPKTREAYREAVRRFLRFLRKHYGSDIADVKDLDHAAACYLTHLADTDVTCSVGSRFLSGLLHFLPEVHGSMPLMARAMAAFRRIRPGGEGEGFSEEAWVLLLTNLLAQERDAFLICAVSVDCFLRGDEWDKLRTSSLHAARVNGLPTLSLHLPQTKCGVNEGVNVERGWVRGLLLEQRERTARRGRERCRVFSISRDRYAAEWDRACDSIGLVRPPHAARHAGATIAAHGRLSNGELRRSELTEIQARGRWAVLSSVRRYAKPHVMARVNARFQTTAIDWARSKLTALDNLGSSCTMAKARSLLKDPPPAVL